MSALEKIFQSYSFIVEELWRSRLGFVEIVKGERWHFGSYCRSLGGQ
jgi:hypothetical protein